MQSHFRKLGEKSGCERMQSGEMENKQFQRHRDARELQIEGRMKERMVGKIRKKADIKGHTV